MCTNRAACALISRLCHHPSPPGSENPGSFSVSLPPHPENLPRNHYEASWLRRISNRIGWPHPPVATSPRTQETPRIRSRSALRLRPISPHACHSYLQTRDRAPRFPGVIVAQHSICRSQLAHNIVCINHTRAAHAAAEPLLPAAQRGPTPRPIGQ